jgi:hypothetical protein
VHLADDARRRGLPTAQGGEGDVTIFTYDAVRVGHNVAGGASCDDARRRGLPTTQGGESDVTIFTYDVVLSDASSFLPLPLARVLFLCYRCLDLAATRMV